MALLQWSYYQVAIRLGNSLSAAGHLRLVDCHLSLLPAQSDSLTSALAAMEAVATRSSDKCSSDELVALVLRQSQRYKTLILLYQIFASTFNRTSGIIFVSYTKRLALLFDKRIACMATSVVTMSVFLCRLGCFVLMGMYAFGASSSSQETYQDGNLSVSLSTCYLQPQTRIHLTYRPCPCYLLTAVIYGWAFDHWCSLISRTADDTAKVCCYT